MAEKLQPFLFRLQPYMQPFLCKNNLAKLAFEENAINADNVIIFHKKELHSQ